MITSSMFLHGRLGEKLVAFALTLRGAVVNHDIIRYASDLSREKDLIWGSHSIS